MSRYTENLADEAHWLLTIEWAGRTWRIADAAVDVTTDDGDTYVYSAGIDDPDVDEAMDDPAEGTSTAASVSLDVLFPSDVPALIAAGHDPSTMRGELARWVEGTTWEKRRVLLNGAATDPEIGDPSEPVALTLDASPWEDQSEIPTASEAVIGANWADDAVLSIPADMLGLAYPLIYGRPGKVDTSIASTGWVTGSEAVWVDCRRDSYYHDAGAGPVVSGDRANLCLLLAGHHVGAESVYLNNGDYTTGARFHVTNTHDKDGHPVALLLWYYELYAGADPADPLYWDSAENLLYEWDDGGGTPAVFGLGSQDVDVSFNAISTDPPRSYVGWYDVDNPSKGGKVNTSGVVMRNAAEIVADLLSRTSTGIDRGRFATAASALSRFNLDFQVNERVKPWDFIRAHILPILPMSLVVLPTGIAPVVWLYGAPATAAVARLDATIDAGLERVSRVAYDRSRLANDITVNFAKSVRTGEYCGSARVRGDVVSDADETTGYADPFCAASQRRYKDAAGNALVVSTSVDSDVIYDTTTAIAVAQWQAAAYALARRAVDYEGSERRYGALERGSVVLLTDERMGFADVVAIVTASRIVGAGRVRLRLMLQEDPVRDLVRA